MTNLNLSIPESMNYFIQEQANKQGYPSPNDYICSLIMEAQKQVEQERLEQLLIEGLESGKSIEINDEWWDNKKNQLIHQSQPEF